MAHLRTDDYRVRLDAFEGPLDLLLYLIRKHEVDIHDIPIADLAEQFVAFAADVDRLDIDQAGEFLLMAATLMEIKSRTIAFRRNPPCPGHDAPAETEEDPRQELVRQLLEFKKYRDAARDLEDRLETWRLRFPAAPRQAGPPATDAPEPAEDAVEIDPGDVDVLDLVEAFGRIMRTVDLSRVGDHQVTYDDTPIELHAADLLDRVKREHAAGIPLTLAAVFTGRSRGEMIGLFLAMLDLVRRQAVRVLQDAPGAEILIEPAPDEAASDSRPVEGANLTATAADAPQAERPRA
jgi:segregation and condensation protein A